MKNLKDVRVLIYSPDSFGLSHFRRCRKIAHAIVAQCSSASVVIISGSQIASAFDLHARVDLVKIPALPKNSLSDQDLNNAQICFADISVMRQQIIQRTAEVFKPDVFITDGQPSGLNNELEPTLQLLSQLGVITILGLCNISQMGHNETNGIESVDDYYNRIWIYGPRHFLTSPEHWSDDEERANQPVYTGFLRSELPTIIQRNATNTPTKFILVTAGGGEDSCSVIESVLAAREHHASDEYPMLMVLGPYMEPENKQRIRSRASALNNITILDFESNMEDLFNRATAIVGSGGYNAFCEALSYNKNAMYLSGGNHRHEHTLRASNAQQLGWCELLTPSATSNAMMLAQMLNRLPEMPAPFLHPSKKDLDGLNLIGADIENLLLSNPNFPNTIKQSSPANVGTYLNTENPMYSA